MGIRLVFGYGKIEVTRAIQDNRELLLLRDHGTPHPVGCSTGLQPGKQIEETELEKYVVLEFNNPESVQVVIDALEDMKMEFYRKGVNWMPDHSLDEEIVVEETTEEEEDKDEEEEDDPSF